MFVAIRNGMRCNAYELLTCAGSSASVRAMKWRLPAVDAVALGGVLLAALALFVQGLTDTPPDFDEGVYLASADALRHGQELGTDVFSSQMPGFYSFLVGASGIFGVSLTGLRTAILIVALGGCVAAYAVGRLLDGPLAGVLAGLGVAAAPFYGTFSHRIAADLIAVSLLLVAFALLLARGGTAAVLAGLFLGTAVTVKISAGAGLLVLGVLLAERRLPLRRAALALGAAVVVWAIVLLRYRHGLGEIWDGAVTYHQKARDAPGLESSNEYRLRQAVLGPRVPWAWLLGLGAVGALAAETGRVRTRALWIYAAVAGAFLLWHKPLHDNHFVLLAPAAVAAAVGVAAGARILPRPLGAAALAAAAIAVGAAYVSSFRAARDARGPVPPELVWGAQRLREATTPDQFVATDRQYTAVEANRRVPGDLVDTAVLRFETGLLTPDRVIEDLQRNDVRAVFAGRAFLDQPEVMRFLRGRYPHQERFGDALVFTR